jgi:hypothetical protein
MRPRSALDRAALALGAVSLVSVVFVVLRGDWDFVRVRGWAVAVAAVLGAVAMVAGWAARPALAAGAGIAFLAAAVVQLVAWAAGDTWLGGDGSTIALWLGLGIGLVTVGAAPRIWPDEQDRTEAT